MVPVVPGFGIPKRRFGKEYFERLSPATQAEMLGPGKYDAWKRGQFDFEDLASIKPHRVWGPNVQVTPLKALV